MSSGPSAVSRAEASVTPAPGKRAFWPVRSSVARGPPGASTIRTAPFKGGGTHTEVLEYLSQNVRVGYLDELGYQVLSDWGPSAQVIDPSTVDWTAVADAEHPTPAARASSNACSFRDQRTLRTSREE